MNHLELILTLDKHSAGNDATVTATTPHGTYTFDIVNVEGDESGAVLRLVQRDN